MSVKSLAFSKVRFHSKKTLKLNIITPNNMSKTKETSMAMACKSGVNSLKGQVVMNHFAQDVTGFEMLSR